MKLSPNEKQLCPGKPGAVSSVNPPVEARAPARVRIGRVGLIAAMVLALALMAGFVPRWRSRRALLQQTRELAVPTIAVTSPAPGRSAAGVALPAEVKAYVEAPIYARANGYLKRRHRPRRYRRERPGGATPG